MTHELQIACRCGQVKGRVTGVSPATVNRAICFCDDCQSFAHHLGREDVLGPDAGSDIVQVAPDTVTFATGHDRIQAIKLGPRGIYRFFATCCNAPIGNVRSPGIPFIGFPVEALRAEGGLDAVVGPPRGEVFGNYATGGSHPKNPTVGLAARVVRLLLRWKLGGHAWPHPFFERGSNEPKFPVTMITKVQREALRAKCGPRPATS